MTIVDFADYGRQIKPFFIEIPNFWAWADNLGKTNFGSFGVFSADLSAPCFLLINNYFYKKLRLYIQIPKVYLGLGFEFGPQRIRDLAIVCP